MKADTQSDMFLKITGIVKKKGISDSEIIDDQTVDNELNYQLAQKDDKLPEEDSIKETISKISAEDLF